MNVKVLKSIQEEDRDKLKEQFALDVLKGFSENQKRLSSKYFYDAKGSELFSQIMDLEDYYPTECEIEIFEKNKNAFADIISGDKFNLIELGAGDGRKTRILIEAFLNNKINFEYLPIDISRSAVEELCQALEKEFPNLPHTGVVGEYMDAFDWIRKDRQGRNVVLFLGSNIGNFNTTDAMVFLRVLWRHLNDGDYILIGFDLKKDVQVLRKAYNDSEGVTSLFNLNILHRINRELQADFNVDKFMHYGAYNALSGMMESYLISTEEQVVQVKELEKSFHFRAYEAIHLEFSNKYLVSDIERYAKETGFKIIENYSDHRGYYVNSLWQVQKQNF